jgi:hypothetical protein
VRGIIGSRCPAQIRSCTHPSAADRGGRVSSRDERKPMAIWTAPGGIRVRGVPTLDALQPPTSDVTRITVSGRLG